MGKFIIIGLIIFYIIVCIAICAADTKTRTAEEQRMLDEEQYRIINETKNKK